MGKKIVAYVAALWWRLQYSLPLRIKQWQYARAVRRAEKLLREVARR